MHNKISRYTCKQVWGLRRSSVNQVWAPKRVLQRRTRKVSRRKWPGVGFERMRRCWRLKWGLYESHATTDSSCKLMQLARGLLRSPTPSPHRRRNWAPERQNDTLTHSNSCLGAQLGPEGRIFSTELCYLERAKIWDQYFRCFTRNPQWSILKNTQPPHNRNMNHFFTRVSKNPPVGKTDLKEGTRK